MNDCEACSVESTHYAVETGNWDVVSTDFKALALLVDGEEMRQALGDSRIRNDIRIHVLDRISQVGDCLGLGLRKPSDRPINGRSVLLGSKSSESSQCSLGCGDAVLEVPKAFDEGLDTTTGVHVIAHSATAGSVLSRSFVRGNHVRG